ncbi:MAG: hypothetical protein GX601_02340 [Anaerolineales bacterium]|nr:hypothetical protein [Anaerolineales bacterium]
MSRLDPRKLHVRYLPGADPCGPLLSRCYTLTHSDATGDLFLTIGPDYDRAQIAGWYTRLMRDEVLADWQVVQDAPTLHLYCHVSGGFTFGSAAMRDAIFRRELPLVLEAFRYGDSALFARRPKLDQAVVLVHFHARQKRRDRVESWGKMADYAADPVCVERVS